MGWLAALPSLLLALLQRLFVAMDARAETAADRVELERQRVQAERQEREAERAAADIIRDRPADGDVADRLRDGRF